MNFFRTFLRKIFYKFMPAPFKASIMRRRLRLDHPIEEGLTFKIAETQDELEQAYRLIYRVFRSQKYTNQSSSEMRLTKYNALPSTKTLIVVKNTKVIATVTLLQESPFGTPAESSFDLGFIKNQAQRYIEISSLAFDPDYDKAREHIMLPLFRFMFELVRNCYPTDYFVAIFQAQFYDFFNSVFLFEKISEKIAIYELLNSRPAICTYLDVNRIADDFERVYSRHPSRSNLYDYLYKKTFKEFQLPDTKLRHLSTLVSAQTLNYFFNLQSNIFATLTSFEKKIVHQIYHGEDYKQILPPQGDFESSKIQRHAKRFEVDLEGQIVFANNTETKITIKTASRMGIGGVISRDLILYDAYRAKIQLPGLENVEMLVTPVWRSEDLSFGFVVKKITGPWMEYITSLERQNRKAS